MTEQAFILLNARVKLRQRHLWEWDTLAAIQQEVLHWIKTDNAKKLSVTDGLVRTNMKKEQATRLIRLIRSQRQVREQMKAQHKEEKARLNEMDQPFPAL